MRNIEPEQKYFKKNKQKLHIYTVDTARTIEVELE